MKPKLLLAILAITGWMNASAQSELYPKHFDLEQIILLDGPMKKAMDLNIQMLMQYDTDRLLTPYVRQAGLADTQDKNSKYYQWTEKHPNFSNWGDPSFDLSGHVGGHYLSALALAYAACHDADKKAMIKERMDYMLQVMKDCQDQYDQNTEGLYGFIGGQPINNDWKELYKGHTADISKHWGWVPFYCQHKILAGLRDAYLYGNSTLAKELFRKLSDWSVNLISKVSDKDFQGFLNCEHGGMNESLVDAYQIFGDEKYLTAAKRYTHQTMLEGMQTLNTTFLDGKHANTQVPKYIGMERIGETKSASDTDIIRYCKAAENFWQDVAENRTVCIGGNSVNEHFLGATNSDRYIEQLDGPESCNSNNMLKLSEMMADRTNDAKYSDFYESTMWNHILSTQDPVTGGYVYFTTLRPQGYRIYSQPNQGMWCCVGTGMENHSKYGHFIYTHEGSKTLYVNLFIPSKLVSNEFVVTQETNFPNEGSSTLTIGKTGTYAIAIRHPAWAGKDFDVKVNGKKFKCETAQGMACFVTINRNWKAGDTITITIPMELHYETCPNYTDYIAFKYGPILLGANTTNGSEKLQNEYGGEGRMDHSPNCRSSSKSLTTAPLLICNRADVLKRIQKNSGKELRFTIDASRNNVASYQWNKLTLQPFYQIHHDRYMCYWYQASQSDYNSSAWAALEEANEKMAKRTIDFVAPGEQQSEAGHEYDYSIDSNKGEYHTEHYRDTKAKGHIQYTLYNSGVEENLSIMLRFNKADKGRKATLTIDGIKIDDITITDQVEDSNANGFFNVEYPIPSSLTKAKKQYIVRLTASETTLCPGLYYLRLLKKNY